MILFFPPKVVIIAADKIIIAIIVITSTIKLIPFSTFHIYSPSYKYSITKEKIQHNIIIFIQHFYYSFMLHISYTRIRYHKNKKDKLVLY